MKFVKTGAPKPTAEYLQPTEFFDFEMASVREFVEDVTRPTQTDVEKAISLYYAVRDTIRYDPYRDKLDRESYKASNLLAVKAGFCLPKANLLVATARAVKIHAAIGLSDVINHLCTERLRNIMGGKDLFINHGYAVLYLGGHWVKAAPAFNIELCERFHVMPTEFDGKSDALFQPFDTKGRLHMEYVRDHGIWSDFPFNQVGEDFCNYYPDSFCNADTSIAAQPKFDEEQPLG